MPPRGTKPDRLSEAEQKIDALQRQLARLEARPANVSTRRSGTALAKLKLDMDSTETAEDVDTFWFDGAAISTMEASLSDVEDWLTFPGQRVLTDTRCLIEFMHDAKWYISARRQIEHVWMFTTTFGATGTVTPAMLKMTAVSAQSEAGFSIVANKVRIPYAGEYGYDFFFDASVATSSTPARVTVGLNDTGAVSKGPVQLIATFNATSTRETRSGSGVFNCPDDSDMWLSYETSGLSNISGPLYLRLWSINLDPRP